ncbi:MAG: type II CAAX endopeptidase family protein [Halobacteriales archaeon]|nr:type II CAAX endopeptidase family protein [Halobacteriales archaeon]
METDGSILSYLWNGDEGRLRAPWRIVVAGVVIVGGVIVFPPAFAGALTAAGLVQPGFFEVSPELTAGMRLPFAVILGVTALGVAVSVWLVARYVDRRKLGDYGLRFDARWLYDLGFGLFLGAVLPTLIFAVGWLAGWYRVTGFVVAEGSFVAPFALLFVFFVFVGVYEELIIRGWLLTNVSEGLVSFGERTAVVVAVLLTSSLFGVLHLPNPGASLVSATIITLAGVFLALGYVLTGELGVPIGIHITWNLFHGVFYDFGVSGISFPVSLVKTESVGPEYVTGGEFGPEAGLLGASAVVIGSVAILLWVRWREGETRVHEILTTPDLLFDSEERD